MNLLSRPTIYMVSFFTGTMRVRINSRVKFVLPGVKFQMMIFLNTS